MLSPFDYVVIGFYLLFMLSLGWLFRGYGSDGNQYFRGGGRMSWWMAGTSGFMGAFSAWTFTGAAGVAYDNGIVVLVIYWAGALGFLVNALGPGAWFRQTRVVTVMEAVRFRLGPANEQIFTWLGMPTGILISGVTLYGLAIFCAPVFGFGIHTMILVCGVVVVFLATAGGAWAVVASDFLQALMLVPITLLAAVLAWRRAGGWAGLVAHVPASHWDVSASSAPSYGAWFLVALVIDKLLSNNSLPNVGRFLCVRSGRDARRSALLTAALFMAGSVLWFIPPLAARAVGMDMAARFPGLSRPSEAAYIAMVAQFLPAGLMGLMVTGIVSATMSAMDHGLNRNAGIFIRSVYVPLLRPAAGEGEQVLAGRIATAGFGAAVVLAALLYSSWRGVGVFSLMLNLGALLGIPTAVPLVLCLFVRRVPDWAAWSSFLAGFFAAVAASGAPALIEAFAWPRAHFGEAADWAAAHRYAATSLVGFGCSALWYLGAAALFGLRVSAARRAEVGNFFETIRRPIEPAAAQLEAVNHRGTRSICLMALLYAGFILLLVLIPNRSAGRWGIAFCSAFMGGVALALWAAEARAGARQER